ncbi:hypothetical protein F4802DRAFT_586687 [Xylaria palmicola]|nr:hypothetical protein F4802DRAFT_586687 [Xylaria palmicola]
MAPFSCHRDQINTPMRRSGPPTPDADSESCTSRTNGKINSASQADRGSINSASETVPESINASQADRESINSAFQVIKKADNWEYISGSYPAFHFNNPASFQLLQSQLKSAGLSGFVADKVRIDWDACEGDLLLRLMPTVVHEYFQQKITATINEQIRKLGEEHKELRPFCKRISDCGHADIATRPDDSKKSPDAQFFYRMAGYPRVIIEIAYSESERKALDKTDIYLESLPSCTVLTFDLNYTVPKEHQNRPTSPISLGYSFVTIVKSTVTQDKEGNEIAKCEVLDESIFRAHGRAVEGCTKVPFQLFVAEEDQKKLPEHIPAFICFEFEKLAEWVTTGEKLLRKCETRSSPQQKEKRVVTWTTKRP